MNRAIDKLTSDHERSLRERFPLLHAFAERGRIEQTARDTFARPLQPRREAVGQRNMKIARILARDGDVCCYCRKALGDDVTLEHRVARSQGGTDELDNLKLAHARCNQAVGSLPPDMKDELAARLITKEGASL